MGFVYLLKSISSDVKYKIGVTRCKDITKRIKKLQTGNSYEIVLEDYFETKYPFSIEAMLHKFYYKQKDKGEWFSLDSNDVKMFHSKCEEYNTMYDSLKNNNFYNKIK